MATIEELDRDHCGEQEPSGPAVFGAEVGDRQPPDDGERRSKAFHERPPRRRAPCNTGNAQEPERTGTILQDAITKAAIVRCSIIIRPETQQRPRRRPAARRRWLARFHAGQVPTSVCLWTTPVRRERRHHPFRLALDPAQSVAADAAGSKLGAPIAADHGCRCGAVRRRNKGVAIAAIAPRPSCRSVASANLCHLGPGLAGTPGAADAEMSEMAIIRQSGVASGVSTRHSLFAICDLPQQFGSTMLCLGRRFTCFYALFFLAALHWPANASDPFPFGSELMLDAAPMQGTKRMPMLQIDDNGSTSIDLWCTSVQAQATVGGDGTITIVPGATQPAQCTPERESIDARPDHGADASNELAPQRRYRRTDRLNDAALPPDDELTPDRPPLLCSEVGRMYRCPPATLTRFRGRGTSKEPVLAMPPHRNRNENKKGHGLHRALCISILKTGSFRSPRERGEEREVLD